MAGVITASELSWITPFSGLSPRQFGKLVTLLRRQGADAVRKGRPWSLPLEDRALLVAAYWRMNLTMRQLAPLFGVSKSAADRIIDHLGPMIALQPRKRFAKDTVLIVDGTLVPTRAWKILRDCRLKGDGVHHAMLGIARMYNLALAG
ncbi:transposase family protein [Streptomyces sp. NPDC014991]|uniref:transposase family protein n=1 Tax=Streptomyces sp. NPDC014991 TaxID=3364935 RepID=UPI0036F7A751